MTKKAASTARKATRSSPGKGQIKGALKKVASSGQRVHVISHKNGWAIKREGTNRATKIVHRKKAAVSTAKSIAHKKPATDIVIHKKDGTIEKWVKGTRRSSK